MGFFSNDAIKARQDARVAKTVARQNARKEIREDKFSSHTAAYNNGIDPKAAWANAASDMTESVANFGTSVLGKGQSNIGSGAFNTQSKGNSMVIYVLGGVVLLGALMFMGGSKK